MATLFTSYFPFDSGPGATVQEAQWTKMASSLLGTGVLVNQLNLLQLFADSSGMQCKVHSGRVWIQGFFGEMFTDPTILAIAAADPTNPRIDRAVVHLDETANTIDLRILTGTPAPSPTPPSLTQTSTVWEISLGQIAVAASASTIAAGNITDERTWASITVGRDTVQIPLGGVNRIAAVWKATDGKEYHWNLNTDGTLVLFNATDSVVVASFAPTGFVASNSSQLGGIAATGFAQIGAGNLAATPVEIIVVGPDSSHLPAAGVKGRIGFVVPFTLP